MSDQSTGTGIKRTTPIPREEMGAAVMPEDSGEPLTPYALGDTSDYDNLSVDDLVAEHNALDAQRNEINARLVAVNEVRARKEFQAEREAATAPADAAPQSASAEGAEAVKT